MNPLLPGHSGTTPDPSRNALNTSQGTNEDDSQNDAPPEAGLFHGQMTRNSGPEDGHDMVTGVQRDRERERERVCDYDMVTGVQRERERESLRPRHGDRSSERERERICGHDMLTGVQRVRERVYGHDMVTGATKQIGNCHNMTGVHEEVTYCPLVQLQGNRRKTVLPVNHNSAVKTHLR